MKWQEIAFKEFIVLQRGYDLPRSRMIEGPFPVVGSSSIIGLHNEFKQEPPGVVTGRSGTLGEVQFVDTEYWPHNTSLWVKDFKNNDPRYVYYKLKTLNLAQYNGGGAVPTLNRNNLDNLMILVPQPDVQQKIASILSAYDDLIENNNRRIKLLEESARLLYREWFVYLRFPGYEHTRIVGGLPEGWKNKSLTELAIVNRATMPNSFDGDIEYVDISSVGTGQITGTTIYAFRYAPSRARRVVKHGDIVWSCVRPNRRSYAVIWQPVPNLLVSTGFAVITPINVPTSFLYFATTTDDFVGYLTNHARGAAYPAVVAADFERAEFLIPPKVVLNRVCV